MECVALKMGLKLSSDEFFLEKNMSNDAIWSSWFATSILTSEGLYSYPICNPFKK